MPFHRPCEDNKGNGCGKRFQPTGRNNKLCNECRLVLLQESAKKRSQRLRTSKEAISL